MKHKLTTILLLGALLISCHIDSALFSAMDDEAHFRPPPAPPTTLAGRFSADGLFGIPGAQISFYLADGSRAADLSSTVATDGAFEATIPGTESHTNLIVYGQSGALTLWGIFPEVPAALQVYDYPQTVSLGERVPDMDPIDEIATVVTLLVEGKARSSMGGLGALSSGAVVAAIEDVAGRLSEEPLLAFRRAVILLLTEAAAHPQGDTPVFLPPHRIAETGSALNTDFLLAYPVDYDGDGAVDVTTGPFEDLLAVAAASFQFDVCYDPDLIKVVFQVDFNDGALDLNCQPIDRMRWLTPDSGDTVFLTGAVHEDMVRCSDDAEDEYCATEADTDLTNQTLGNFVPNTIELFDDGSNGDAVAGDGVFSRAFELPRGMRIGYKYNYGRGGEGWTGTEEWPGNSRLIELIDVTGDEIVVRRDFFGDESTNKDRANTLSPARGGRGSISWESDANGDGLLDAREVTIDVDRDCVADDFPAVGPNEPLTLACE